jgi:hypothetical protein
MFRSTVGPNDGTTVAPASTSAISAPRAALFADHHDVDLDRRFDVRSLDIRRATGAA